MARYGGPRIRYQTSSFNGVRVRRYVMVRGTPPRPGFESGRYNDDQYNISTIDNADTHHRHHPVPGYRRYYAAFMWRWHGTVSNGRLRTKGSYSS